MFKGINFKKITVYQICILAMLVALTSILSFVSGYLRIGNISKFSISFVSVYIAAAAFGPFAGGLVGALADIVSYFVNPIGGYIPWFTLIEFVNGFVFGMLFYRTDTRRMNLFELAFRAVLCSFTQLAINMFGRTYILVVLGFMPQSFWNAFAIRLPASALMAVIKVPALIMLEGVVPSLVAMARAAEGK